MEIAVAVVAIAFLSPLVAIAELVSRYSDNPGRLFRYSLVWLYCGVNGVAALATFVLIRAFGWTAGFPAADDKVIWVQALASAFASTVVLRSSIFKARIGDHDVDVGPAMVLQQLLKAVETQIGRREGLARILSLDLLHGVAFSDAVEAAPELCAGLLQGLTEEQQALFRKSIEAIKGKSASDQIKLRLLCLELVNVAGPEVVGKVAEKLRP